METENKIMTATEVLKRQDDAAKYLAQRIDKIWEPTLTKISEVLKK
jgi:hypothetical protein